MTVIAHQNNLQSVNFQFTLNRAPNVEFFSKEANIPGLSINPAVLPTPFAQIPIAGDHIDFEQFQITFDVDENLANFKEIFNWMMEIGFPSEYSQYKDSSQRSDGTLTILNGRFNPLNNGSIVYEDMWPTSLSGLSFSINEQNVVYASATASFAYKLYRFI